MLRVEERARALRNQAGGEWTRVSVIVIAISRGNIPRCELVWVTCHRQSIHFGPPEEALSQGRERERPARFQGQSRWAYLERPLDKNRKQIIGLRVDDHPPFLRTRATHARQLHPQHWLLCHLGLY
jgi:hypothetical protein